MVLTLVIGVASAAVIVSQTAWFRDWLRGYIVREAPDVANTFRKATLHLPTEAQPSNITGRGRYEPEKLRTRPVRVFTVWDEEVRVCTKYPLRRSFEVRSGPSSFFEQTQKLEVVRLRLLCPDPHINPVLLIFRVHVRRVSSLGDAHQSNLFLSGAVKGDDSYGKIWAGLNSVNHHARKLRFDFHALWIKTSDSTRLIVSCPQLQKR